ncbi:hypothetical protein [Nocardioides ochotonae]|uniref:hypothetical protein n=1 Tax=Nocardioides ochotonae TaxID=2685869 RepID=UPI001409E5F5|nr:hypothetical protein [Nocardioides ochotonae]
MTCVRTIERTSDFAVEMTQYRGAVDSSLPEAVAIRPIEVYVSAPAFTDESYAPDRATALAHVARQMSDALTAAARAARECDLERPWWHSAPNPPCRPWCDAEHDPAEFSTNGSINCSMSIRETDWFGVELHQITGLDEAETTTVVDAAAIWEHCTRDLTECSPDEIAAYAAALLVGAEMIRKVSA